MLRLFLLLKAIILWNIDPSEIIIICSFAVQDTYLIVINVEKVLLHIFVYFFQIYLMNRKYKIFCNVIYIYIKLIPAESKNSVTLFIIGTNSKY